MLKATAALTATEGVKGSTAKTTIIARPIQIIECICWDWSLVVAVVCHDIFYYFSCCLIYFIFTTI